jgi:hypothetical protein
MGRQGCRMSLKSLQFVVKVADNWEMGYDGSSLGEEAHGPLEQPPASDETDHGLEWREPYLRRVLDAFEAGRLEPYEYTQRVLAINAATSNEQMEAIVEQPAERSSGPAPRRGLDAVDLARLRSPTLLAPRGPTTRYVALAIVFVLFAVLTVIGMWLATHVHGAALNSNGTLGRALGLAPTPWS